MKALSIYLSIYLSSYLSIFESSWSSIFVSVYVSIYLSIYLSIHPSIDSQIYLDLSISSAPSPLFFTHSSHSNSSNPVGTAPRLSVAPELSCRLGRTWRRRSSIRWSWAVIEGTKASVTRSKSWWVCSQNGPTRRRLRVDRPDPAHMYI